MDSRKLIEKFQQRGWKETISNNILVRLPPKVAKTWREVAELNLIRIIG